LGELARADQLHQHVPLLTLMVLTGMAGTYQGARLTGTLSLRRLLTLMGIVLLVVGGLLLWAAVRRAPAASCLSLQFGGPAASAGHALFSNPGGDGTACQQGVTMTGKFHAARGRPRPKEQGNKQIAPVCPSWHPSCC